MTADQVPGFLIQGTADCRRSLPASSKFCAAQQSRLRTAATTMPSSCLQEERSFAATQSNEPNVRTYANAGLLYRLGHEVGISKYFFTILVRRSSLSKLIAVLWSNSYPIQSAMIGVCFRKADHCETLSSPFRLPQAIL
jgi:hypothetical protein